MSEGDPPDIANPRLSEAEISALAVHGARTRLRDGEPVFDAGERRGGFYIVLKGQIEVLDRAGETPRTIGRHGPGQFTGDIDILTRRRPVVGAVARGETEVLGISSSAVRRIITERPRLGETILRAFIARREELLDTGVAGMRVIGSGSSRESLLLREFLSRNHVPFTWLDVDEDSGIAETLQGFGVALDELPIVTVGGKPLMRRAAPRQVADILGLLRPVRSEAYDLVIVGAGPAGLAAAVYGASEGLNTLVFEAVAPGGQASASTKIENYLGFPTGISGADLTARATLQAQKFGAELSSPAVAVGLSLNGGHPSVLLESGEQALGRCVLIATGATYRRLDVPGRERFDGAGVYYAATPVELSACRGMDVVVIGGGNSAGQAVMFLSEHAPRVCLLLRGDDLRKSMSSYLADRVEATENVEVLYGMELRELHGGERLEEVTVRNVRSGAVRTFETSAVFCFIGAVPHTNWLPSEIETDDKGFIRTGRAIAGSAHWSLSRQPYLLETSRAGIFAAGDVRYGAVPRISSAVGEGAMVVKYVHEYLADLAQTS